MAVTIGTRGRCFVRGHSWLSANGLRPGDFLATHDGAWARVDAVDATEAWGTVYNLRVHEDHTYFVGKDDWGFAVWAHNTYRDGLTVDIAEKRLRAAGIPHGNAAALLIPAKVFRSADPALRPDSRVERSAGVRRTFAGISSTRRRVGELERERIDRTLGKCGSFHPDREVE